MASAATAHVADKIMDMTDEELVAALHTAAGATVALPLSDSMREGIWNALLVAWQLGKLPL